MKSQHQLLRNIRRLQRQRLADANRGMLFSCKRETMSDLAHNLHIQKRLQVA